MFDNSPAPQGSVYLGPAEGSDAPGVSELSESRLGLDVNWYALISLYFSFCLDVFLFVTLDYGSRTFRRYIGIKGGT